jgi:hypothetical protein
MVQSAWQASMAAVIFLACMAQYQLQYGFSCNMGSVMAATLLSVRLSASLLHTIFTSPLRPVHVSGA